MLDADIHATVNSDDPAYFGGYIDANYHAVRDELGLTTAHIETLALNSFDASFAPRELREAWKDEAHAWSIRQVTGNRGRDRRRPLTDPPYAACAFGPSGAETLRADRRSPGSTVPPPPV